MKGVWEVRECTELCSKLRNSHFLHGNSCVVFIKFNHEKQTWAEDQKQKISLEWPSVVKPFHRFRICCSVNLIKFRM